MTETPARLLKLLSLLQTPREWPGPELADRLGVSQRTVRNDIERLRSLGYPVEATRGRIGGYRLGAGAAMPPLLLDDDEAVVISVALRTASSGGIAGMEETALRALTKLQQVLPTRLRRRVEVMAEHTVRAGWRSSNTGPAGASEATGWRQVDPGLLATVAAAASDREILRFGYVAHAGEISERRVEPYRLVNLGRRWYLLAYDLLRDDWRTFRVDRMTETRSVGHRFRLRPLPAEDVGEYVAARTRQVQQRTLGTVEFDAPAGEVAARMGDYVVGTVIALGDRRCRVSIGGRSVDSIAFWLGILDVDFTVVDSPQPDRASGTTGEAAAASGATGEAAGASGATGEPGGATGELAAAVRRLGERYLRAAR